MAKYRINTTVPTVDGSGCIEWRMSALDDDGEVIPWMETKILTPSAETQDALADPNPAAALKALLALYAPARFLPAALDAMSAANAASFDVKESLGLIIQEYPFTFDV